MLEIKVIMNSSIEEVLAFKCCHLMDQNLEIHLKNVGQESLAVPSSCELVNEDGRFSINYLYPQGGYTIHPGETVAYYCSLPDAVFEKYQSIVFRDASGREHRATLRPMPSGGVAA
jgi:hypothetical protein